MSHITTIEIEVKDLEALKLAAEKLGLEFCEGQRTYKWYGRSVGDYPLPAGITAADLGKCDHALRVKGAHASTYEIGVVKSKTGPGYRLLWDFYAGGYGLQDRVGEGAQKLMQGYATEATIRAARAQGLRYMGTKQKQDGTVQLQFGK